MLKRSGCFVLKQGFPPLSEQCSANKRGASQWRSNKHFEGFLWVGFQSSCGPRVWGMHMKKKKKKPSQTTGSTSQAFFFFYHNFALKREAFIFLLKPIHKKTEIRVQIQHEDNTNRLVSGALPKEEWCVCVCVCVCVCQSF